MLLTDQITVRERERQRETERDRKIGEERERNWGGEREGWRLWRERVRKREGKSQRNFTYLDIDYVINQRFQKSALMNIRYNTAHTKSLISVP